MISRVYRFFSWVRSLFETETTVDNNYNNLSVYSITISEPSDSGKYNYNEFN